MIRTTLPALALLILVSGAARADLPAPTPVFKAGSTSSGWIAFTPYTNLGLFIPIKVNGHATAAFVFGGASAIDPGFAGSIGLQVPGGDESAPVGGIELQLGDLSLHDAAAKASRGPSGYFEKLIGSPIQFQLGEEIFKKLAVDIDYPHHRLAFRDAQSLSKPAGAVEVPLVEQDGEWVIPLAVNGAAPQLFELELGNVIGPLLVTPAYAQTQKLFEGHATSQRLSGPYRETVVSIDHLSFAGVDFPQVPIALIPDTELPPASITGGVGLPLLAKYRLIIDYAHNRLYAIANGKTRTPIAKDRIGLILDLSSGTVRFVAPHSPAEAAGIKEGDKVAAIDGKPFEAWPVMNIYDLRTARAGDRHRFTLADGSVRQVKAIDFY